MDLVDYMGCIENIGNLNGFGTPDNIKNIWRTIVISNLDNDIVHLTLLDEHAVNFDVKGYERLEKPVILAVSSCLVTGYKDQIRLVSTSATHCYFNPSVPEYHQSIDAYRKKYKAQMLEIDRNRRQDINKERILSSLDTGTSSSTNPILNIPAKSGTQGSKRKK